MVGKMPIYVRNWSPLGVSIRGCPMPRAMGTGILVGCKILLGYTPFSIDTFYEYEVIWQVS